MTDLETLTEEELLGCVGVVAEELAKVDARREVLLDERRSLFAELRARDPKCPLRKIADAAGLDSATNVSVVLTRRSKAIAR